MILATARLLGHLCGTAARVLHLAALGHPDHEHAGKLDVDEWAIYSQPVDFEQRYLEPSAVALTRVCWRTVV